MHDYNKNVVASYFWKSTEVLSVNIVQVVIFIILARILSPEDFGILAIVIAILNFSNLFISGGLSSALIQKEKVSSEEYSSVFIFSFLTSIILFLIMYFLSPIIANYYEQSILENALKFGSIVFFINSLISVQKVFFQREVDFKFISKITIFSSIISGCLSIYLATVGFGVYSLISNYILVGLLSSIFLFFKTRWFPSLIFNVAKFKKLLLFGLKVLTNNLIDLIYLNLLPLIIGKHYGLNELGYYNNGRQIPSLFASTINAVIMSVSFPLFSRKNYDRTDLFKTLNMIISISNFIVFPLITLLILLSNDIIIILFTEKWLESSKYLQLFCLIYLLHHHSAIFITFLNSLGNASQSLYYNLVNKIFSLILALSFIKIDLINVLLSLFFSSVLFYAVTIFLLNKYFNISIGEQFKNFFYYLLFSIASFCLVNILNVTFESLFISIFIKSILFLSFYLLLNFVFKSFAFRLIISYFLNVMRN